MTSFLRRTNEKMAHIVSQPNKCLEFMAFRGGGGDVLKYAMECKYLSEAPDTFCQHVPFCAREYTQGFCYISLFKFISSDQSTLQSRLKF